jgi:hypothetical protein
MFPILMYRIYLMITTKEIRTRNPELKTIHWELCIIRRTKISTGNAKQTSSCWIHWSVRTTRILTKNPEDITRAKVSWQFVTAFIVEDYCIMMIINMVFVVVIILFDS